jgi:TP901 family phage tail tape measure protein
MGKRFQDLIKLDFEIGSKGEDRLKRISAHLERIEKSLARIRNLGPGLDKTFKPLDKAAANANKAKAALKKVNDEAEKTKKTAKGFTVFGESIGKLAGKISLFVTLTAAIVKVQAFVFDLVKSIVELEEAMARVATVTRATSQTLASALWEIRKEVFSVAKETKKSFQEITVAAYAAGSAGLTVSQQIASIKPVSDLVVGTLGDMEFTAKLVAGSFNVFSEKLGNAETDLEKFRAIADTVADTFSRQQIELSELEAGFRIAASAVSLLDVDFNELVGTLGFLNTGMLKGTRAGTALMNATIQLAKNADKLKTTFNVSFDPTKPLKFNEVITQVAEQIKEGGVSTEEFKELIEAFGIRGARAVAQIVNNMERYKDAVGRSAEESKHMAEVLAKIQTDTLVGAFTRWKNTLGESFVLLNDILGVTNGLKNTFVFLSKLSGAFNKGIEPLAGKMVKFRAGENIKNEERKLRRLEIIAKVVRRRVEKEISGQKSDVFVIGPALQKDMSKLDQLKHQIDVQKKYLSVLKGEANDTAKAIKGAFGVEIDPGALPKSIREAMESMAKFREQSQIAAQVNGDIFVKVSQVNDAIAEIVKRAQTNKKVGAATVKHLSEQKFVLTKNLDINKRRLTLLQTLINQTSKHVGAEKEVLAIHKLLLEIEDDSLKKKREIAKFTKDSLRELRNRYQIESLTIKNTKDEVVLKTKVQQILNKLKNEYGIILSLEDARKKTEKEILSMGYADEDAKKDLVKLAKALNDEKLQGLRKEVDMRKKNDKDTIAAIEMERKERLSILKAYGSKNSVIAKEKIKYIEQEVTALKNIKETLDTQDIKYKAVEEKIAKLNQQLQETVVLSEKLIPIEERRKLLTEEFLFLQEQAVIQGDNELERARIKVEYLARLNELAAGNNEAAQIKNTLEAQGVTLLSAQREEMLALTQISYDVAQEINDGIKQSLFDSLMNAKRLDEALNNVGDTIGKIILEKQFNNLMDQLLGVFDIGGMTVESQIGKGGDLLVTKLQTSLPPLFNSLGDIVARKMAATQIGREGMGMPGFPEGGGGGNISIGGGKGAQAGGGSDFMKGLGNVFSGAMSGASLANARGGDQTSQVMGAVGGAIGNAILPGIGGIVGGFLGSLFGGKKEEEKEEAPAVAFRLDLSNTILRDINRNLTAIREDSTAYALQSSFYFSANRSPASGGVIFEGDFILNGSAAEGDITPQSVGEAVLQTLSEEGVRGAQA